VDPEWKGAPWEIWVGLVVWAGMIVTVGYAVIETYWG
jgi:hypothetical protein